MKIFTIEQWKDLIKDPEELAKRLYLLECFLLENLCTRVEQLENDFEEAMTELEATTAVSEDQEWEN